MATGLKTGGRRKGTANRLTSELRETLKQFVEGELSEIPELVKELTPKERLDFFLKVAPFVLPKVDNISSTDGEPWKLVNMDMVLD